MLSCKPARNGCLQNKGDEKPDLRVQQVTLEGQPVEAVQTFNYLGTLQPQQVNNSLCYVSDALFSVFHQTTCYCAL